MGDASLFSRQDLQEQREKIRGRLLRANTTMAVVLLAVIGLALAAVIESVRSARQQRRAEFAEREAQERLWNSSVAQARAARLAHFRGWRAQALGAISNAAPMGASSVLRSEAIAAIVGLDLEVDEPLHKVAASHDEAYQFGLGHYALASRNGDIEVHDARSHRVEMTWTPEGAGLPRSSLLSGFEFLRDGRHVLTSFKDSTFVAWELGRKEPVLVRKRPGGAKSSSVTASLDGRVCVVDRHGEGSVVTWMDLSTGTRGSLAMTGQVHAASLRPGRHELAVLAGREVQLWDYDREAVVGVLQNPVAPVGGIRWSGDGARLAVGTTGGDVFLWNVAAGRFRALVGHTEPMRRVVFSPDGTLVMTVAGDNTTRVWDTQTGRALLVCSGELGSEFSEDGERIGFSRPGEAVGVWRLQRSPVVRPLRAQGAAEDEIQHFDLSTSGRWLSAVVGGQVQLWDLAGSGGPVMEPLGGVASLTMLPDEKSVLLCRSGRMEIRPIVPVEVSGRRHWRLGTAKLIPLPRGAEVRQATISQDGRSILVERKDFGLIVLDALGERAPVALEGRQRYANSLTPGSATGSGRMAVSGDGRWVAVGYSVGPVDHPAGLEAAQFAGVWDARTGRRVFTPEHFGGVVFSPGDHRLVLRSREGCLLFAPGTWTAEKWLPLENLGSHVGTAALQGDGRMLAVSEGRQSVRLLDPSTGVEWATLMAPIPHSINRLRLALDGSRLAMGTVDGRVDLWDMGILRREIALLGLESGAAVGPKVGVSGALSFRVGGEPVLAVTAGIVGCGSAVAFSLLVLRRHRELIEGFVRTEATVEKRSRQLESAMLELVQAEKMRALGTLAAGIGHDFNNLLSVIRMSSQLVRRLRPPKEAEEYLGAIETAVVQGKMLVGSMLGYSRATPGSAATCDVCVLVEETARLLSREFLAGILLHLDLDRSTPRVAVNRGKLQQMLLNLVVNAAEAMKGSGTLTLSVRRVADLPEIKGGRYVVRPRPGSGFVQAEISDSGPGIEPEILHHIFEPFFTTKVAGNTRGTGLGLALVHMVATQEGLGLAVKAHPGCGAAFHVFLPVD